MYRTTALVLALLVATPHALRGQEEVEAVLSGTLLISGAPADTGTVALHRVTPEEGAQIDSTVVGADGSFSFLLPNMPIPGSGEVFFASHRYDGVLYSGDPISDPVQLDSVHVIRAFPTRGAPSEGIAFPVSRREIWIAEGPMGWEITDVLEILNPDSATFVPEGQQGAVWRYPLPPSAMAPRVLQTGPMAGPTRVEGTILVAANAVVPASNYYVVQYDVPSLDLDIPLPGETRLVQLLLREPAPAVTVGGLAQQPPEEIEFGTTFLRWAGEALRDQTVSVRLGEEGEGQSAWLLLAAALSLVLIGAGSLFARRKATPATAGGGRLRRDILVDLARLDEEHAGAVASSPALGATYRKRRAALLDELSRAEGER